MIFIVGIVFLITVFFAFAESYYERDIPRRTIIFVIVMAIALLCSVGAQAQNSRYDYAALTVTGSGNLIPLLAIPGATVSFYTGCTSLPCSTYANVYTSATGTTACPTTAQIVLNDTAACVAVADGEGNFGGWFLPGQYQYTITAFGATYGPYSFTVAITSGGSAGAATNLLGGTLGSAPYQSAANTTAFLPSPTATGTYFYGWQTSGSAVIPSVINLASFIPTLPLSIANGGTGQITGIAAINALLGNGTGTVVSPQPITAPNYNGAIHTDGTTLAAATAATPAGGTLYIDPGTYTISSDITRTTAIHIVCDPAALIKSDGPVWVITTHSADGSSVDGCNWGNISTAQVCAAPPAATFNPSTCTGTFIVLARFPNDLIGYEASATDGDVWPSMTTAQQTNSTIGAEVLFGDVDHIRISKNAGGRVRFVATYSLSGSPNGGNAVDFIDNKIICGASAGDYGCLTVAGDSSTFVTSTGLTIKGVHINRNTVGHNGSSGAISIGNTAGAEIGDNIISYNGEANIKTLQNFSTFGNVDFNIHDNDASTTAGNGVDLQPDFPTTTVEETSGKFVHNTIHDTGIESQNGGGVVDAGSGDLISDNTFRSNKCSAIQAQGGSIHVIGNQLFANAGDGSCGSPYSIEIQSQAAFSGMIVAFNTIAENALGAISVSQGATDPVLYIGNTTNGVFSTLVPTLELADVDNNGPRQITGSITPNFSGIQMGGTITNSVGFQIATVTVCATSAVALNGCAVTVPLPVTEPNAAYTVSGCVVKNPSAGVTVSAITSQTTTQFTASIVGLTTTANSAGTVTCTVTH